MESLRVERLDHCGLIASVIKDLHLIERIDACLMPDEQEALTPGQALAGMILNGLGFTTRPLSLTPQFFANKPLDLLFRDGVHAGMFNRFTRGRTLEEVYAYGCDLLLSKLALAICIQEGIDQRFNHLDTTSFSLSGDYVPESDEQAIRITHGYSKDHRPDLKQAVLERAEATVRKARQRESDAIEKQLFHLQAQRFETPEGAQAALVTLAHPWAYHQVGASTLSEHNHYVGKGRPRPTTPVASIAWQIHAQVRPDQQKIAYRTQHKACFVVGTNIAASQLSDREVIVAYKGQAQAEGGFRFLKDPLFFVSSLFVKKPCRIQGLLMVMICALLVFSVTQRRLRHQLAHQGKTGPNQINQPTARPTLRWVFQLLEGIHRVRVTVQGQGHDLIEGLNEVQIKILRLFGEEVCRLYQISSG